MTHPPEYIRFCASRDGVRIAFATTGTGYPLVRAPHHISHLKFDWDSAIWRPWLSAFSQRHALIRYDCRGCGLSDRDHIEFSLDRYVDDLEAVVAAVGVQRFAIFGMSGGGATAVAYAARNPERVTHLVLLGCYSRARLARNATPRQIEEAELQLKAIELGFELDNPGLRQLYASIRMPDGNTEQYRSFNDLMRVATTPANAANLLRANFRFDVHEAATQVRCPTMVFHAREDSAIPFDEGRSLAALIPNARFVPLESRNHLLVEGEPAWEQFVRQLDDFLPAAPPKKSDAADRLPDGFTGREHEILDLVAQGLNNGTIATKLGISERTVRNNVSIILSKLDVHSRAEAIVRAREAGLGQKKP